MNNNDLVKMLKAEHERQSHYANHEGAADSDTSCDAARCLDKAVVALSALLVEVDELTAVADAAFIYIASLDEKHYRSRTNTAKQLKNLHEEVTAYREAQL